VKRSALSAIAWKLALGACAAPAAVPPTIAPTEPATATATAVPVRATAPSTAVIAAPTAVGATAVTLNGPTHVAFDAAGNLYVAVCGGPGVVKIDSAGKLSVFASRELGGFSGDGGPAISAEINCAQGLAFDREGNLYLADQLNNRIRRIDRNGIISTVAGSGPVTLLGLAGPPILDLGNQVGDGGPATAARLQLPSDVAFDAAGNLYIDDGGNNRIRKVDAKGILTTVAGNGTPGFSGDGGPATAAQLNSHSTFIDPPGGIAIDSSGNLYIADSFNHRVRKVDGQGIITTVAGNGGPTVAGDGGLAISATLSAPIGLAFDASDNLYIAATESVLIFDNRIRKVDMHGVITTMAGTGEPSYSGDGGPATAAALRVPSGIGFDAQGNMYFADSGNGRVRKVDKKGIITTVAGGVP
jgi:sugar lactone lactonase YvrE